MSTVSKPKSSQNNRRTKKQLTLKEDKIYFDGKVIETFPGTQFGIEIKRRNELPPLIVKCSLKSTLIKRRVMVIKGDEVKVEINPEEMANTPIKGTIVERLYIPPVYNKPIK